MMFMKNERQRIICEIIKKNDVKTQGELAQLLALQGVEVTQTTVSRDIKELKLIKTLSDDGTAYRYTLPESQTAKDREKSEVFVRHVSGAAVSGTLCVLNTQAGSAMIVARTIDLSEEIPSLGTISGYDTVLVAFENNKTAQEFCGTVNDYIKNE